jgi:flagellin-like protein
MRKSRLLKDKRGISPVIATVIIVAVTIAVAIAVAFWMGGLTTIFTRFEKLEITSAYADLSEDEFTITLNFKNTGSAAASISDVLINGRPASATEGCTQALVEVGSDSVDFATVTGTVSVPIGSDGSLEILGDSGTAPFVSGVTVEVTIHTAAGKDYPKVVVLP